MKLKNGRYGILLLALWAPLCLGAKASTALKNNAKARVPAKSQSTKKVPPSQPSAATLQDSDDYVTEKRADGTTVKYKKKNSYDFEGVGIDGIHNKPSGSYVSNIKDVKARSIIRLRENFDAEVVDSSRQMK